MKTGVRVYVTIDGELIQAQAASLDCVINVNLLGREISKNALCPTMLQIVIDEIPVLPDQDADENQLKLDIEG